VRPITIATATQRADGMAVQEMAALLKGIIQSAAHARGWRIVGAVTLPTE
jgi:hypothetical protein